MDRAWLRYILPCMMTALCTAGPEHLLPCKCPLVPWRSACSRRCTLARTFVNTCTHKASICLRHVRAGDHRPLGGESQFPGDAGRPLHLRGLSVAKPAAPLAASGFQGDGL